MFGTLRNPNHMLGFLGRGTRAELEERRPKSVERAPSAKMQKTVHDIYRSSLQPAQDNTDAGQVYLRPVQAFCVQAFCV